MGPQVRINYPGCRAPWTSLDGAAFISSLASGSDKLNAFFGGNKSLRFDILVIFGIQPFDKTLIGFGESSQYPWCGVTTQCPIVAWEGGVCWSRLRVRSLTVVRVDRFFVVHDKVSMPIVHHANGNPWTSAPIAYCFGRLIFRWTTTPKNDSLQLACSFGNTHILTQKKGETINTHPGYIGLTNWVNTGKKLHLTTQTNHIGIFSMLPQKTHKIITLRCGSSDHRRTSRIESFRWNQGPPCRGRCCGVGLAQRGFTSIHDCFCTRKGWKCTKRKTQWRAYSDIVDTT